MQRVVQIRQSLTVQPAVLRLLEEYETITGEVLTKAVDKHKEKTRKFRDLEKNEIELQSAHIAENTQNKTSNRLYRLPVFYLF